MDAVPPPPPPPPPSPLPPERRKELSVQRSIDGRALAVIALCAALTDLALRSGGFSVAGVVLVVAVSGGMLWSGRLTNPQARALVAAAPLFGLWVFVRASPWLLPLDVIATTGMLVLGASLATTGSIFDLTASGLAARGMRGFLHGAMAPGFVAPIVARARAQIPDHPRQVARYRAIVRGALLAAPLLIAIGVLLASADAVFAAFFHLSLNAPDLLFHIAALVGGAWGMAGLVRVASAGEPSAVPTGGRTLGRLEAAIVLGSLDALFATFAVSQLVALSGAGERILETRGLTYAQYARSGFFQLLAVAAITLILLLVLRAMVEAPGHGIGLRLTVLFEATVALTLVVVAVSVRRLGLYEQAFGLTMLRLYSTTFAWWIGAVFVLLGVSLAGVRRTRPWLTSASIAAGFATLLALNIVNPEAIVVRHNIGHAERTGRFDPAYVAELSDDAVPTILALLPRLDPGSQAQVMAAVCPSGGRAFTGAAAYNVSHDRAAKSRRAICPATSDWIPSG
jgi:hypothetical protein